MKQRGSIRFLCLSTIVAAGIASVGSPAALAAGFEMGPQGMHAVGRGGAFVVKADDPSALFWNPSRLALSRGTHLLFNDTISMQNVSFQRLPAQKLNLQGNPTGDPIPFGLVSEQDKVFALGMSVAVTTDFGLEDWGFGFGFSGPAAYGKGSVNTDTTSALRYSYQDHDVLLASVYTGAAWKYKEWFGIGTSLMFGMLPNMKYSLAVIGPGPVTIQNHPVSTVNDLQIALDMKDWFTFSAVVGAWGRPLPFLELAVSAQFLPIDVVADGDIRISGTPNSIYKGMDPHKVDGRVEYQFPMKVLAGARYLHVANGREIFDIEADFAWENWKNMDAFQVDFLVDEIELLGTTLPLKRITLDRGHQDTYSVRLGGQWNAIPHWLTARAGAWWESAAQKDGYAFADFPSFQRFGVGLGLSTEWRGIEFGVSYAHVFQQTQDIKAGEGRNYQQILMADGTVNKGYAVNEGTWKASTDMVVLGLSFDFDRLIKGR